MKFTQENNGNGMNLACANASALPACQSYFSFDSTDLDAVDMAETSIESPAVDIYGEKIIFTLDKNKDRAIEFSRQILSSPQEIFNKIFTCEKLKKEFLKKNKEILEKVANILNWLCLGENYTIVGNSADLVKRKHTPPTPTEINQNKFIFYTSDKEHLYRFSTHLNGAYKPHCKLVGS